MSKEYYKQSKKIFPKFNKETDTVIVGSSRDYNIAKMKNMFNRQKAALHLANMNSGNVRGIDLANKKSNVVTKDNNNYNVYSLVDKDKAKNAVSPLDCWKGYERVPGTKQGAKGSCRKSSPAKATKGGGTTKVCLPQEKVNNMSSEQKEKVVNAKESAGRSGKRERSQGSEVKGARKKGATLKDWFEKENWVNVKTGQECGAPTKRKESNEPAKTTKGKGRNFRTVEEGAGMTEEGVKDYKKKNPGSNLQTAVTGPVSELSEKEKARRKSFCARSKGWTGERGKAARKRWRC